MGPVGFFPKRRYVITTLRCIISQKNANLFSVQVVNMNPSKPRPYVTYRFSFDEELRIPHPCARPTPKLQGHPLSVYSIYSQLPGVSESRFRQPQPDGSSCSPDKETITSEILKVLNINNKIVLNVTPCSLVGMKKRFGQNCCLLLHGRWKGLLLFLVPSKWMWLVFSETSVHKY
jgi:hypothetical protein